MTTITVPQPRTRIVNRHIPVPVVFLASYPRSGNTFVRQILFEAYDTRSYTTADHEPQTEHFGGYAGAATFDGDAVAFIKTHQANQTGGKTWHIVRDGRDALASFAQWVSPDSTIIASKWGQDVMAFDAMADVTTKYEDLLTNPIEEVGFALEQLGLQDVISKVCDTITPFAEMHKRDPHHWRGGRSGDRRGIDVAKFEDLNRDALEHFGYL